MTERTVGPVTLSEADEPARAEHVGASQGVQSLHRNALPTVRAKALAWRNGLAALLAGLVSFGLIKGQADIGSLERRWAVAAGVALLGALACGAAGAHQLLLASHGRPARVRVDVLRSGLAGEVAEAERAVAALNRGIRLTYGCLAFLVLAVAMTWYGPAKAEPRISVQTPAGRLCGAVVQARAGVLTLRTDLGDQQVDLSTVTGMRPIAGCGAE